MKKLFLLIGMIGLLLAGRHYLLAQPGTAKEFHLAGRPEAVRADQRVREIFGKKEAEVVVEGVHGVFEKALSNRDINLEPFFYHRLLPYLEGYVQWTRREDEAHQGINKTRFYFRFVEAEPWKDGWYVEGAVEIKYSGPGRDDSGSGKEVRLLIEKIDKEWKITDFYVAESPGGFFTAVRGEDVDLRTQPFDVTAEKINATLEAQRK